MRKSYSIFSCLVLIIGIITSGNSMAEEQKPANATNAQHLDSVVAIVNSDVVTESELNKQYTGIKQHLEQQNKSLPSDAELRSQVLNHIIDQKIILQTAARANIEIDDDSLNRAIRNIASRNNMTKQELKQTLAKSGIDFRDYREDLRKQITIDRLMQQQIGSRVTISKQEVDKYLNSVAFDQQNIAEYHINDILIALPDVPSSQEIRSAKTTAEKVLKKLKQGHPFSEVAIAESNGQDALKGGDLGWRRVEEIPSVFADYITKMDVGDVQGPIRTANGFHIMQLVDTRGSAARHFTQETKVRHILIKSHTPDDDDDIIEELKDIRKKIEAGASFAQMAKEHSDDVVSREKDGTLGWISPGMLVPAFEQAMDGLTIGMVSQPVKTQFGWHLIQVQERRKKEDTHDYQRNKIRKLIYERQFEEEKQHWITKMRSVSYVQSLLPEADNVA